jgi:hypothetical protein
MPRWVTGLTVMVGAVCAMSACSKSRANTASAATSDPGGATAAAGADTVAVNCGKTFSPKDLAGLLTAPVTTTAHTGNPGWCDFGNDQVADVNVSIGDDETSESVEWNDATKGPNRPKFVALPGVGDQAMYKARTAATNPEVVSKKGTFYCLVTIDGGNDNAYKSLSAGDLAKRLGALCNKMFAAAGV